MMRKKIIKLLTLVLSTIMISSFAIPVMASTGTSSSKDIQSSLIVDKNGSRGENSLLSKGKLDKVEEKVGTISLTLTDGKTGTSKQNVEFALTKVADVVRGEYVLDKAYGDIGIDLNNIKNASDLEAAATKLVEVAGRDTVVKTDLNGKLVFSDLSVGVYLIYATNDDKYDDVTPLLVSIPTWSESEGNMMYDVNVIPKHTPKPEKPCTPNRSCPQTDLNSPVLWYFGGALGLAVLLVVVNKVGKKRA